MGRGGGVNRALLITGDYVSLLPGEPVPKRGTAVCGLRLYDDGQYLGSTVSTPARAAFEYVIEPDGNSLRITYTPEKS
jgi:hypothetical protein